jgi:uncharacterized protein YcfJ
MDIGTLSSVATVVGVAVGGYAGGRLQGRSSASQIAADTVEMLQTQVELLKEDKESRDGELTELRHRVEILESLVTQRAEVEELGTKISLVKDTVDRIAIRVGA